uniref:Uncharacterized protein n=1 Tax=Peronospora matthiolae TaxID=2874970 RepID=A0AAV1VDT8_9STRA
MATRRGSKPSVFTAFNQLRVAEDVDSDDGSEEERQQERKEKQKLKKKSRSKKKNSDSAQLKDLAFVSVSKPKKSKSKKKTETTSRSQSPTNLPVDETQTASGDDEEKKHEEEAPRPLGQVIQTPAELNGVKKKPQSASQQQQQQKKKTTSPREQPLQLQPQLHPPPLQHVPPPAPVVVSPIVCTPQSSSETELGAVYTPSHITITRVDGQMKRTVAVTDVMDQLLRYTQQNSQLLLVQEQLGHANRSLQDQLQRRDEIITGLQHEVTMFRQMCLNLQAEVSLLRSSVPPNIGSNGPPQHRPPPGMS